MTAMTQSTTAPGTAAAASGRGDADIHLDDVTKRFGDTVAVDGLTLSIERGAFYAMLTFSRWMSASGGVATPSLSGAVLAWVIEDIVPHRALGAG